MYPLLSRASDAGPDRPTDAGTQAAYDVVHDAHRDIDALVNAWSSLYKQEKCEAIEQVIRDLQVALEVL